jgi:hypothetical protein
MNNPPAFPAMHFDLADNEHGMTLRDYFAAHAMMVLYHGYRDPDVFTKERFGKLAYEIADQMLKAREQT